MIKVTLTLEQKNELERLRGQASSKDSEKALMVLMNNEGKSPPEISCILKRNPHTVRYWLRKYQGIGIKGLFRSYSPGRPKDKREGVKKLISEIIGLPPESFGYMDSVWSVPLIVYAVGQKLSEPVSEDTVTRALKEMGYTYKRPSKTVPAGILTREEKEDAIKSIINEINTIVAHKECELYVLDESHFSTEPYLVRGWFKKRRPPQDRNAEKTRMSQYLDA